MREDWVEIQYKDIVKKISLSNKKLKQKEYLPSGKIPVIDQGQELIGGYTDDESKLLDCKLPCIVFGDHTKIVKLINFPFASGADGTKVIEPKKHLEPKILKYFTEVLALKIKDKGYARHYQDIEKSDIVIPPKLEQKAIVAKIEQLFSELDNAVANLKTAKAKLKIYRQAVLKKAFEGELTKEWREKNKVRFDWIHTTTGEIMPNISSGSTPKAEFLAEDGEIQFLKVYNLNFDGTLNKDKDPVFTTRDIHRVQNKRAITIAGDVLINIVGPPLGKTSMIPLNCNLEYNINQAIVRFRPNEQILPKFLSFFMQNPKTINWLEGTSKATAGQRNVKVTTCRLIPISLPSIPEQNQIVQEIESRLSVCDKIEETIETSLAKSEALRQSILKKAFEGKLLSGQELENIKNHPEYESAEALLKRIKKERDK